MECGEVGANGPCATNHAIMEHLKESDFATVPDHFMVVEIALVRTRKKEFAMAMLVAVSFFRFL